MHAIALRLYDPARQAPQLPGRGLGALPHFAVSAVLHVTLVVAAATVLTPVPPPTRDSVRSAPQSLADPPAVHVVFRMPSLPEISGGGGGGGGNQRLGPIRRAQGIGTDAVTLRTRSTPPPAAPIAPADAPAVDQAPELPSIFLDAVPQASGVFDQIGLPNGTILSGMSTGPGSGGGVGTGVGTGMGSGRGSGLGPGSGGGTGGGAYRPGGAVSAPRLLSQVKPQYTPEALQHQIQGAVVLEVVVTREGRASNIRVIGSLDAGLDQQAVAAVQQWRFAPGRLAGAPVDVLVTIRLDFAIR